MTGTFWLRIMEIAAIFALMKAQPLSSSLQGQEQNSLLQGCGTGADYTCATGNVGCWTWKMFINLPSFPSTLYPAEPPRLYLSRRRSFRASLTLAEHKTRN